NVFPTVLIRLGLPRIIWAAHRTRHKGIDFTHQIIQFGDGCIMVKTLVLPTRDRTMVSRCQAILKTWPRIANVVEVRMARLIHDCLRTSLNGPLASSEILKYSDKLKNAT
ncbi:hypothetical protein EDB19DRAFT_1660958, partial [Suillus lakei]